MITLNGIVLPDDLYINEFNSAFAYSQQIQYTLGGKPVINTMSLMNGNDLVVYGNKDSGWITYGVLQELQNDVKNNYNNIIILDFNGKLYYALYKMPQPLDFQPILDKVVYDSNDYFYGSINLIKI